MPALLSSVRTYVEGLKETSAALLDLIAANGLGSHEHDDEDGATTGDAKGKRKLLYADYLPLATLQSGIKSGQLIKGYFNANPFDYLEGTVNSRTYPKGILLVGRKSINRAVHGDEVVVQILPEKEWRAPGTKVREQEKELRNDDADSEAEEEGLDDEEEDERKEAEEGAGEKQVTGRIIGVAKRNWRP